jgi:uncharacterized protein (TIGR00661 family)
MLQPSNILFAILDWGLGHATRSEPIIAFLVENGHNVYLAGSGKSAKYISTRFPSLPLLQMPDYRIEYAKNGNQIIKLMIQAPRLWFVVKHEHKTIEQYVKQYNIDFVFSDNRFGAYSKHCHSIYITHQLQFFLRGGLKPFSKLVARVHRLFICNYSTVLVPDNKEDSIAGDISTNMNGQNTFYIGPLSRFYNYTCQSSNESRKFVLFLLSGTEPQRSILEQLLIEIAPKIQHKIVLVRGVVDAPKLVQQEGVEVVEFAEKEQLFSLILNAEYIVCRSGYSTIMDLWEIKRKAILVPTPGQPEQEYLSDYLKVIYGFESVKQKHLKMYNWNNIPSLMEWEHNVCSINFKEVLKQIIS